MSGANYPRILTPGRLPLVNSTPAFFLSLRKDSLVAVLRMSKVALGLFDILLQFAPDTRSARVGFVGSLFEEFKFASRPIKA